MKLANRKVCDRDFLRLEIAETQAQMLRNYLVAPAIQLEQFSKPPPYFPVYPGHLSHSAGMEWDWGIHV